MPNGGWVRERMEGKKSEEVEEKMMEVEEDGDEEEKNENENNEDEEDEQQENDDSKQESDEDDDDEQEEEEEEEEPANESASLSSSFLTAQHNLLSVDSSFCTWMARGGGRGSGARSFSSVLTNELQMDPFQVTRWVMEYQRGGGRKMEKKCPHQNEVESVIGVLFFFFVISLCHFPSTPISTDQSAQC